VHECIGRSHRGWAPQPFCRVCTRARLSADGQLFTCLFASRGHDLRSLLRGGGSDDEITERLITIWTRRTDRYSELLTAETRPLSKVEMSLIGG
jgi:cyclic pyranopterin phosphate synthase